MISLLLFIYFFCTLSTNGVSIDFKTKPLVCSYSGNKARSQSTELPLTEPSMIPKECEVIMFMDCDPKDVVSCKEDLLNELITLNRSVIMTLTRSYDSWLGLLNADGNANDAKMMTDFAKKIGIIGIIAIVMDVNTKSDSSDKQLSTNIVPYLQQLKYNPEFIVGVLVNPGNDFFSNNYFLNNEAVNVVVDLYFIFTFEMNSCSHGEFNGNSPIHAVADYSSLVILLVLPLNIVTESLRDYR